jgi:hypothetical protein
MKITKGYLEELHHGSLEKAKSAFANVPRRLFVDGEFNEDNWRGGDASLIREFFRENYGKTIIRDVNDDEGFQWTFIIKHIQYEDQNYATITIHETQKEIFHQVLFSWYKERGRTEKAIFNGREMTEEEYLFVLNLIQLSDHKIVKEDVNGMG